MIKQKFKLINLYSLHTIQPVFNYKVGFRTVQYKKKKHKYIKIL